MRNALFLLLATVLAGCQSTTIGKQANPDTIAARGGPPLTTGDAVAGQRLFQQVRCVACHSVYGAQPAAAIPLPDFSKETPEKVASLILFRAHTAPAPVADQAAMSEVVGRLTLRDLGDIVAYLRQPVGHD